MWFILIVGICFSFDYTPASFMDNIVIWLRNEWIYLLVLYFYLWYILCYVTLLLSMTGHTVADVK